MAKGLALLFIFLALCIGGTVGFILGVATSEAGRDLLSGMAMEEQAADVRNPVTIDQPGFRMQHPGNWTYDLTNADHDPAHYFFIDTPGGSYYEFSFEEEGADPESETDVAQENLDYLDEHFQSYLAGESRVPLQQFGRLKGKGLLLSGRALGHNVTVRLFSYSEGTKTLLITEYVYDMDRALLQPGIDLLEKSIEVK